MQFAAKSFLNPPELLFNEVHVWMIGRDDGLEGEVGLLSALELARLSKMRPDVGRRFVAGRRAVRMLLGGYLQRDPKELEILVSPRGKPYLAVGQEFEALEFNLSHSGDRVAIAIGGEGEDVGVDIEMLGRLIDEDQLRRLYLSAREREKLGTIECDEARGREALRYWVAKEAFLKARGTGFGEGVDPLKLEIYLETMGEKGIGEYGGEERRGVTIFEDDGVLVAVAGEGEVRLGKMEE